jgi:hypothetical protein
LIKCTDKIDQKANRKGLQPSYRNGGMGGRGECWRGVNATLTNFIYCKNFFRCHNCTLNTTIKKHGIKKRKKNKNIYPSKACSQKSTSSN